MAFWYNLSTRQVESNENRSAALYLLGPFATRKEAESAIETAHEQAKESDEADAAWNRGD
jgi:hypothetical protein